MGIFLIGIPLAGCNKDFAIVFFVLVTMMMGLSSGGDIPIVAEMTSEFAATVFSIMNTISSFTGFFAPMLVGFVIDADPYSITLWSYVYYFSAFLCFLGSFIFLFFASAKSQNW